MPDLTIQVQDLKGYPGTALVVLNGSIDAKTVTYDFHRQMEGATKVSCSQFGTEVIKHM